MIINNIIKDNMIEIYSKYPIPSVFKFKFLGELIDKYELKHNEVLLDKDMFILNENDENIKEKYFEIYKSNSFNLTFENFLKYVAFPFKKVEVYLKNTSDKVAIINFEDNLDVCKIIVNVLNNKGIHEFVEILSKITF